MANLRPEIVDSRPARADFRSERAWGTNGRTDKHKSPCVLQDFVPFGAAAPLPRTLIDNYAKQGNGYHSAHIALGQPVNQWSFCTVFGLGRKEWTRRND